MRFDIPAAGPARFAHEFDSTAVGSAEWEAEDGEFGTLTVTIPPGGKRGKGGTFRYDGVTLDTFEEFCNAPSAGRYFNANVRPLGGQRVR